MKVSPRSDYPVGVRPRSWEESEPVAELYDGIFDVTLNRVVDVVFVPDLLAIAPPFDDALLPRDLDEVFTQGQARLAAVLFGRYVVTPDPSRSGIQECFARAIDTPGERTGVVFYVSSNKFARYADDLEKLSQRLGGLHPPGTVADLRGIAVIDFIEQTVLGSPAFRSEDAAMLDRMVQ